MKIEFNQQYRTTSAIKKEEKNNLINQSEEKKDQLELSGKNEKSDQLKATYNKPQPLSAEQIQQLKQKQEESQMQLLKNMAGANVLNQGQLASGNNESLLVEIFGSIEEALPPLATTPEEAAKAIAPGGDYSIDQVAERIMKMATALAGGDSSKIETLQKAVQQGFKEAGMDLETGEGLPEICYDTYNEIMTQFEAWKQQ